MQQRRSGQDSQVSRQMNMRNVITSRVPTKPSEHLWCRQSGEADSGENCPRPEELVPQPRRPGRYLVARVPPASSHESDVVPLRYKLFRKVCGNPDWATVCSVGAYQSDNMKDSHSYSMSPNRFPSIPREPRTRFAATAPETVVPGLMSADLPISEPPNTMQRLVTHTPSAM